MVQHYSPVGSYYLKPSFTKEIKDELEGLHEYIKDTPWEEMRGVEESLEDLNGKYLDLIGILNGGYTFGLNGPEYSRSCVMHTMNGI